MDVPDPKPPASSHRRRKRAAWHKQADGAVGAPTPVLEHPLVPSGDPLLVEDAAALAALGARLAEASIVAFDTEFIGEESFRPRVCLVQVATAREVALIDPLRLEARGEQGALVEFLGRLAEESPTVLVHAGFHDVEAIRLAVGRDPRGVIDTQIAAAMAGLPFPASLATALESLAGHRPAKGHTFTDWDARPLSRTQLLYAADDVRYMPLLWSRLSEELARRGRLEWARRESAQKLAEAPFDPASQVRRIARGELVGAENRGLVRALVLERHAIAREHDLPPRATLPDGALAEIARHRPASAEEFRRLKGIPGRTMKECPERLVATIARALASPPPYDPLGELLADRVVREETDRAWPILQARCVELGLAPELVLVRADFARWLAREVAEVRGMPVRAEAPAPRESPFEPGSWRDEALGGLARELRASIRPPSLEDPPRRRRRRRRRRSKPPAEGGGATS